MARKRNRYGQFTKGRATTRRRRSSPKTKTIVRYRTRSNPTRARRAVGYAKKTLAGVNVGGAFRNTLPLLVGALAAKFAAKKFTDDSGAEGANWTWKNYGLGLAGGFVASVTASALFRSKPATAQRVMEGAFLLIAYKMFVNEIAPSNSYLDSWFSEDDEAYGYLPDAEIAGYLGAEYELDGYDEDEGEPGDLYQADDDTYVMGQDQAWRPVSEMHRVEADDDYIAVGSEVAPVDPTLGDVVAPVDPTLGYMGNILDEFNKAYG